MVFRAYHFYGCNDILSESYSLLTSPAWLHSYKSYGHCI